VSEARVGEGLLYTAIIRDVSVIHDAIETIRSERDFSNSLVDAAPLVVLVLDPEGKIVRYNRYMEELSGVRLEDACGRDWFDEFLPERDRNEHRVLCQRVIAGLEVQGHVNPIVTKDGEERLIEWDTRLLHGVQGEALGVIWVGQDITEREHSARLTAARHEVTAVLAGSDAIAHAAPCALRVMGETGGWELGELWVVDHEADVARATGVWSREAHTPEESRPETAKTSVRRKEGLIGRVWQTGAALWVEDIAEDTGCTPPAESRARLRGAFAFPVSSSAGTVGVIALYSSEPRALDPDLGRSLASMGAEIGDFIARKLAEAELRRLEALAFEQARLADIGAITAKIVHDIGNPISGISLQAERIVRKLGSDPDAPAATLQQPIDRILTGIDRLRELVRSFSEFAREQRLELEPIDPCDLVRDVGDQWRAVAEARGIELTVDAAQSLPPILADESKLRRVLDNLVKNAIESIPEDRGIVRIGIAIPNRANLLMITVSDTGTGIPEGRDVFRLFETTKPDGTGVGLAVAKQIVGAHGGGIRFASNNPHGTIFTVELPLRASATS